MSDPSLPRDLQSRPFLQIAERNFEGSGVRSEFSAVLCIALSHNLLVTSVMNTPLHQNHQKSNDQIAWSVPLQTQLPRVRQPSA